jgi:hypothetical protein
MRLLGKALSTVLLESCSEAGLSALVAGLRRRSERAADGIDALDERASR